MIAVGRMWRRDYELRRCRVGDFGIRRCGESLDPDVAVRLRREVDVEKVVGRVLRMERNAEESPLSTAQHSRGDIQKRRRLQHAVLDDADPPTLLDDEDSPVIERLREENGARKARGYEWVQLQTDAGRQWRSSVWTG